MSLARAERKRALPGLREAGMRLFEYWMRWLGDGATAQHVAYTRLTDWPSRCEWFVPGTIAGHEQ